jgi:hypothetical protein
MAMGSLGVSRGKGGGLGGERKEVPSSYLVSLARGFSKRAEAFWGSSMCPFVPSLREMSPSDKAVGVGASLMFGAE